MQLISELLVLFCDRNLADDERVGNSHCTLVASDWKELHVVGVGTTIKDVTIDVSSPLLICLIQRRS